MFWHTIYKAALLHELQSFSDAISRHADPDTSAYGLFRAIGELSHMLATNKDMQRSEAVLALANIQFEFDHIHYHDNQVKDVVVHMKNLLYDLTGSHKMDDIWLFCDLRDTFYRSDQKEEAETLDEYIIEKMFFMPSMFRTRDHGLTLPYLTIQNATFSDEAISRFYCTTKWSVWGATSVCSRLALQYYHDNGCNDDRDPHWMKFNRNMADLLKPFAGPLPENVKYVYTTQPQTPYVSIDTLKQRMSLGRTYNFTTVGETLLEGNLETPRTAGLRIATCTEFPCWEDTKLVHITTDSIVLSKHIPIVLKIATNTGRGQNVCIRIRDFIPTRSEPSRFTGSIRPQTQPTIMCYGSHSRAVPPEKLLLIPRLSILCKEIYVAHNNVNQPRAHAIIVKCEFTNNIHEMIQNISDKVIDTVHRTLEVAKRDTLPVVW